MHEVFVADDRRRMRLLWLAAVAIPLFAASHFLAYRGAQGTLRLLELSAGVAGAFVAAILIWSVFHRRRPIIEVFDDRVEAVLISRVVGRKTISFDEIVDVSLTGYRLRLTKRSGETVTIKLGSLSEESQRRVVAAIGERIQAALEG